VTSRALLTWPAAQMRIASPTKPTIAPTKIDSVDGFARMKTSGANTQPSATRKRARNSITDTLGSDTHRSGCKPPLDRVEHLRGLDVEEAHPIQLTSAQMMASTHL